MDLRQVLESFHAACVARGLLLASEPRADGEWHQCGVEGKPHGKSGRYRLHLDGIPAGAICNHTDGLGTVSWRYDRPVTMTADEAVAHHANMVAAAAAREEERARKREAVALASDERWDASVAAPHDHPYLLRKQVRSYGLRVDGEVLLVPMRNEHRAIRSMQTIAADGAKRFASGGQTTGLCYSIKGDGTRPDVVCVCEGYATAASVREATGLSVLAAFTCGNLKPIVATLRARLPSATIVICADDDAHSRGNAGLSKAREAAEAHQCLVVWPEFGPARPDGATDFNDLHVHVSLEEVARQVWRVLERPLEEERAMVDAPMPDYAVTEFGDGVPQGYRVEHGCLLAAVDGKDGATEWQRVCYPALQLRGRSADIESGARFLILAWGEGGAQHVTEVRQERALQARYLPDLSASGAVVTSSNARAVVNYLDRCLELHERAGVPMEYLCSSTGWYQDASCFVRGYEAAHVAPDRPMDLRAPRLGGTVEGAQVSILEGVRTRGTIDAWRACVQPLVTANPRIAIALAASAASPFLGIFAGVAEPFCLDIAAETSSGKTTTLALCASLWGSTGMFQKWNDSLTAQERLAGCMRGLPVLRDESQLADPLLVGRSVYDITTKVGRSRGTIAGMQERVTFESILISTGETPVANMVEAAGHVARCVTLWGAMFEADGREQARVIHAAMETIAEHHGHAGAALVDLLVRMGRAGHAQLRNEYRAQTVRLAEQLEVLAPSNRIAPRVAKHLALLEVAWSYLVRATGLQWHSPTLLRKSELQAIIDRSGNSDKIGAALDSVMAWLNANPDRVQRDESRPFSNQSIIARVVRKVGTPAVAYVLPDALHDHLRSRGHHVEAMVSAFLERGYFDRPAGDDARRTWTVRFGGGTVKCYRLNATLSADCGIEHGMQFRQDRRTDDLPAAPYDPDLPF